MAQANTISPDLKAVLDLAKQSKDAAVQVCVREMCWTIERLRRRIDKQQGQITRLEQSAGVAS